MQSFFWFYIIQGKLIETVSLPASLAPRGTIMTSTPATSEANGTEYNFEGQTSSADQEQVSTQKYIKVTKEQRNTPMIAKLGLKSC